MSESEYLVRRATVDDLEGLRRVWNAMHYPTVELERRLTEFQVVEAPDGSLMGALGMEITARQGIIHSEAFSDFTHADLFRSLLWGRVQALAANHGLANLWTKETAPFWRRAEFQPADEPALKRLPAAWAAEASGWLVRNLRDEDVLDQSLEREFAKLKTEEKRRIEKVLRPAKVLKFIATALAIILGIGVILFSLQLLLSQRGGMGH